MTGASPVSTSTRCDAQIPSAPEHRSDGEEAKLPTDVNARAKAIVDFATSDEEPPDPDEATDAFTLSRHPGTRGPCGSVDFGHRERRVTSGVV